MFFCLWFSLFCDLLVASVLRWLVGWFCVVLFSVWRLEAFGASKVVMAQSVVENL